jgi:hypothetical protein
MAVRWIRSTGDPYRGEQREPIRYTPGWYNTPEPATYTPGWWNMPEPEPPVQLRRIGAQVQPAVRAQPTRIPAQDNWAGMAAVNAGGGYPGTVAPRVTGPATTPGPAAAQGRYEPAAVTGQQWQGTRAQAAAGSTEQQYAPAPRGVPAGWYKEFQREHGQTPEQYYGRTGEGLDEALADKSWGEQFATERGRAPTKTEWENHWYNTRRGGRPTFSRDQWKVLRRYQRKSRGGGNTRRAPRPQIISEDPRWRVSPFG